MSKIILSIGHDMYQQGASWLGTTEHALATRLTGYINHPDILVVDYSLLETVAEINAMPDVVLAAELHFNAGGTEDTHGCETLYCPDSIKGKQYAGLFQETYLDYQSRLGIEVKDRGIKQGWYKMRVGGSIDYFLRATNVPALILEPEFIQKAVHWSDLDLMKTACNIQGALLVSSKGL